MPDRTISTAADKALSSLIVSTVHSATIRFVFSEEKRHDDDYRFSLADAIDDKMAALRQQYDIEENGEFLCRVEGYQLIGDDLQAVSSAGRDLALFLAEYDGIEFV